MLVVTMVGCPSLRDRFAPTAKRENPFDRGNAAARSMDRAKAGNLDPADDVFLRDQRSAVAERERKRTSPPDSELLDASSPKNPMLERSSLTNASGTTNLVPKEANEENYRAVRQRLEAIKAVWSSERQSDGSGFAIRCEVPHPKDPELAQVFETKSPNEIQALAAAAQQAEKWLANVRRKFDPSEAELDPWSP
jgi:Xaa-Pro aminopeptidase